METSDQGPSGNGNDDKADLKLGLTIGVPAAALLIAIIATVVVLVKTGKLKGCCTNRHKRAKEDLAQREERKKSIIIIAPTGKRGSELYIARHFYEAEDDNQLSLETGRIVEVQEKLDNGWWRGVTGGKEGWFPATFVKKIDVSDPNSSMHSLSSAVSSTPGSTRHPPPPTGKPPVDNETSTSADIYVNSAFELDNSDADCQSKDNSGDSCPDADTDDNNTCKIVTDKTDEDEHKVVIDNDIDSKLDVMKTEDIEGYLNEIFSVEDETPEAPRKNKLRLSKHSRDRAYQEGSKKRLKDEQNKSLLKEQSQTDDSRIRMPNKKGHSKKVKGSPLINPEHYMISSSESLFSVSSCNEGGDTGDDLQVTTLQSKEEDAERVYDEPDSGQTNQNHDVHRGAPDGSSLVGILPDGQKEFSLERDFINEEDLNINISTEDEQYEKVSNSLTPEKNLQDKVISESKENKSIFVVMYPFTPTEPNQLTLSRNDVVYSLGHAENGWMKGEKKSTGETGWFPISYVREGKPPVVGDVLSEESEALDSDGEFEEDDNMTGLEYRALYPYKAQLDGDLTLHEGDIIIVTESHDNGWWRGCLGEQEGWFPGTYVEPVPQTPASASVYEDVESPLKMVTPLSTSSPVDRVDDKNRKQFTAVIKEKYVNGLRAENGDNSSGQPASTENKDNTVTEIKFKPHVPRRFVKPKLVILPKERKNSMKALKKPSRPPPPVPKDNGNIYNNEENVPSTQHSMELNAGVSTKHESDHLHISEYKRRTIPRPKEPPPPAPAISANMPTLSVETSKMDTTFSGVNGKLTTFSQSVQNEDYEDVEPGLELALSDAERKDSGLGIDISIPGVHTSARLEHSDKSKTAAYDSPESLIDSSLLNDLDHDKSSSEKQKENDSPPKSFSAILGIFEKIVQRDDHSVDNDGAMLPGEDSLPMMIKPTLPPKPAANKAAFRRSHSEPDLLGLTMTSRTKVGDLNMTTDHVDVAAVGGSSRTSDNVKPAASKPALPPRPKMPPHRSRSMGSLVLVNAAEELVLTGEIKQTETVKREANPKPDILAKPKKPPPPSVILKVNTDKTQYSGAHKGAGVNGRKPASAGNANVLDSAEYSTEQGSMMSLQPKGNKTLEDVQMKFETSMEKEQTRRPPRPIQPPVKLTSVPVNKSYTTHMDKHAKVQTSFASPVNKPPTSHVNMSVITQHGGLDNMPESKPHNSVLNRITSTMHAEKPSLIHDKTPVTLLNPEHPANKKTMIPDGDRGQRQKILSNGSLKISTSPENGVKYHHSLLSNRLNESTVQGLSKSSLSVAHPDVVVSNVSNYSSSSPSQPPPPPLPSSPPPDLTSSAENTVSGTWNITGQSLESYQTDGKENPNEVKTPDGKSIGTQMNIRTSSLRFFTPVGFSRSFSSSSVSSSNITISSATDSPVGSLSPDGATEPVSPKASKGSMDSEHNFVANQVYGNRASSLETAQKSPNSLSTKKNNPLKFYTPVGFIPRQKRLSVDDVSQEQSNISSSEHNLSTQPPDDGGPESFGSTGSLETYSSKCYQPYASVELKPAMKRTLTPPKPFLPSRWSAYPGLQKGFVSLAMVDIEIDDGNKRPRDDTKMGNQVTEDGTPTASKKSTLLMISQADLESDV